MSNDQKIAFLCHPYHRGGVTRWMADAALAYSKQGVAVYFITIEPAKEFLSAKGRETLLQLLGKEDHTIRIIKTRAGSEFEFGTQEYCAYIYAKLLLQLPVGIPVILSNDETIWQAAALLYNSYPFIGVLHADEAYYYDLAARYYRQVQALVCVSERVHNTVIQKIQETDPDRIYTIPCGINLPAIDYSIHSGNILQLVYVGRISDYQKRTGDLVKIAALLAKDSIPFHLNIIGDGPARQGLEDKIKEALLQDHVTFSGWLTQKEVAAYLSSSDILILTSDFEGTPVAMMEALAAGCGMVGTKVSGIEDYEDHPLAANCLSVYAVGDMEGAVNKIKKISAIPANIRRHAARELAEAEFSMAVCLQKYMNVATAMKPVAIPAQNISLPPVRILYSKAIAAARYLKVSFMQ